MIYILQATHSVSSKKVASPLAMSRLPSRPSLRKPRGSVTGDWLTRIVIALISLYQLRDQDIETRLIWLAESSYGMFYCTREWQPRHYSRRNARKTNDSLADSLARFRTYSSRHTRWNPHSQKQCAFRHY